MQKRLTRLMRTRPLPYQTEGVRFIRARRGRAILADEMGLGKTYQVAAYLRLQPARPVLVVCPAFLKLVWRDQLRRHAGLGCTLLYGRKPYQPRGCIWIINYEILHFWLPKLLQLRPMILVLDEAHRTQDRRTLRTRACRRLARQARRVIALTGTPIRARPVQFFPMLNMVSPSLFPSFIQYAFRYCNPKPGFRGRGWDFRGSSNLAELHQVVSRIMLRRRKRDVLPQLPPKTRSVVPIEIDLGRYHAAVEAFLSWYRKHRGARGRGEALLRLGELIRVAGRHKVPPLIDWIDAWLDQNPSRKLVVFTRHRRVLRQLRGAFPGCVWIEGATPHRERKVRLHRFETNRRCRLLIGNMIAAGEGITILASSTVVFAELGWTPAEHEQAEDRVLRIGQKARHINAYYFVAQDTIEEDLYEALERKRAIVDTVIDGRHDARNVPTIVLEKLLCKHGRKARDKRLARI